MSGREFAEKMIGRLRKEFADLVLDPLSGVTDWAGPETEARGGEWNVRMKGAKGTPYEDGVFDLKISFNDYPFKPPLLSFVTDIYHCNLRAAVAPHEISADFLFEEADKWNLSMRVCDVIARVQTLMVEPYSEPIEVLDDTWRGASPGGCSGGNAIETQIFVDTLDRKKLVVNVAPTDLIVNLKFELERKTGIPIRKQTLVFAGKLMLNSRPFSDYHVECCSTVHMVLGRGTTFSLRRLIDSDLLKVLQSNKRVYDQRARDHTRCTALDPDVVPLVSIGFADGVIQCTLLSGKDVTPSGITIQETVGNLRCLVASHLTLPRHVLKLVSLTGRDLTQTSDDVPLLEALGIHTS